MEQSRLLSRQWFRPSGPSVSLVRKILDFAIESVIRYSKKKSEACMSRGVSFILKVGGIRKWQLSPSMSSVRVTLYWIPWSEEGTLQRQAQSLIIQAGS
ncbi:hypothetical protein BJX70DRAFT_379766 [Aspergillus crustosus]